MQLTLGFPGRDDPAVAYLRLVSIRRNACFAYLLTRVREGTARQRLKVPLAQSHLHFPSEVGSPLFLQHKRNRGHCERCSNRCERRHITLSTRCGEKRRRFIAGNSRRRSYRSRLSDLILRYNRHNGTRIPILWCSKCRTTLRTSQICREIFAILRSSSDGLRKLKRLPWVYRK